MGSLGVDEITELVDLTGRFFGKPKQNSTFGIFGFGQNSDEATAKEAMSQIGKSETSRCNPRIQRDHDEHGLFVLTGSFVCLRALHNIQCAFTAATAFRRVPHASGSYFEKSPRTISSAPAASMRNRCSESRGSTAFPTAVSMSSLAPAEMTNAVSAQNE